MGTPLRRYRTNIFVLAVITFTTLASYSCQTSSPSNNTNTNATTNASPATSPRPAPPWPSGFPQQMPTPVISGNVPRQIFVPTVSSPLEARPFFDYYSWEAFIALNWPAQSGSRGVPNQPNNPSVFLQAPNNTPVVWGTYRDSFDLFGQKDQRPSAWDSSTSPIKPCPNGTDGQKTLIFNTKGDTSLMQTKQAFSFPLVDQQGNYVYFDIRYDEAQYNFIRGLDSDPSSWLYLLKNLAPKENAQFGVQMPMTTPAVLGSIMVKAAWRISTSKDDPKRFYAINAQIYDSQKQACTPATVLLVGLHIGHKIDPFTEWVWSTFEQVDNVPPDPDVTPKPAPPSNGYSFNNGTDTPKSPGGWDYKPPPPSQGQPSPKPVQVTRVNPIPNTPQGASTRDVNAYYQQLLQGTVWQYYQLVITQWPANPGIGPGKPFILMQNGGVYPLNAGAAFPANGAVNTTMETYFQTQNDAAGAGGNSCMSCHYRAGQSDFSWGLNRRAH
jgi:hypothetical protein